MHDSSKTLPVDIAIGVLAGLVATKVTDWAQTALYDATPAQVREKEERVRPGPPAEIAAEDMANRLGVRMDEKTRGRAGNVVHYALGAVWGPVYGQLRRNTRMSAPGAAFVSGATMSLMIDEGLTPALGYSAPNRDYPVLTHVRGFAGHLVFGAVNAAVAEALYRLVDARKRRPVQRSWSERDGFKPARRLRR
jgi:uncharacterized membrane protein YagU involved in acid resistance